MPAVSRKMLKSFFANGSMPTQEKFWSFIDSMVHSFEDSPILGLSEFSDVHAYGKGSTVVFKKAIYIASEDVDPGKFNAKQWQAIGSQDSAGKKVGKLSSNADQKEVKDLIKKLEERINSNLTAKTDKMILAKKGNLVAMSSKGNITDSDINAGDLLTKDAKATDISVAAQGGLKSGNIQVVLEKLQGQINSMATEMDKLRKSGQAKKSQKPKGGKKTGKK